EGYVHATVGSGTYVACVLPETRFVAPRPRAIARPVGGPPRRRLTAFARRLDPLFGYAEGPTPAFRLGQPPLDLFPVTLWAQIASRAHRMATVRQLLFCDAMGYGPLREAVADYLVTSRGVKCEPGQVAIMAGTLDALHLSARLLVEPGGRAAMESPG